MTDLVSNHEMIRLAAAHLERTHREHVEATREIAGATYRDDLARISLVEHAALSREIEGEDLGL